MKPEKQQPERATVSERMKAAIAGRVQSVKASRQTRIAGPNEPTVLAVLRATGRVKY